jgi:predicted ferric reductase
MLKRHNYALGLAWLGVFFLIPLPFIQTIATGLPAIYNDERLAILYGTIAYSWMLAAIYLSTRPRWLDRLIGLPEMYMLHGILSVAAIGLAYLHKTGTTSNGWTERLGDWAFNLFLAVMLYSLIFLAGWLTSRLPVLAQIKTWLEKVFHHELTIWVHRLNLVATGFIFIHVLLISYIRAITPFMIVFMTASIFVATSYLWFKIQPKTAAQLVANRTLAPNLQELTIQLPARNRLTLQAGDFAFLAFPDIPGMREGHPFSIVNDPRQDHHQLRFAIRGDGDFTRRLAEIVPPQRVAVIGGFGRYLNFVTEQQPQQLVVIAGGTGVIPLLSLIAQQTTQATTFFYNGHTAANLLYPELFAAWQKRPSFTAYRQVGRFSDDDILHQLPAERRGLAVVIGGPAGMARHWIKVLTANGVPRGQIYYEAFTW